MIRYKTIVTDYEGLQRCLDEWTESGWRLFSVTADTWRKVLGADSSADPLEAMGASIGAGAAQYSASYYLVILYREDPLERERLSLAGAEDLTLDDYQQGNY